MFVSGPTFIHIILFFRTSIDEKSDVSSITKETGSQDTVIKGKSRFRRTFICVTGEDSDRTENGKLVYARASQGTFDKFPHYIQEA